MGPIGEQNENYKLLRNECKWEYYTATLEISIKSKFNEVKSKLKASLLNKLQNR